LVNKDSTTTYDHDGERYDDDNASVHSDTSYPDSVEEGLRPTIVDETDLVEETDSPQAWKTLLGMTLVATGTALFCTNGAIVQKHGGSILQLMLGRYVVQNIISSILWVSNPFGVKGTAVHWYGDTWDSRKIIWARGTALFFTVFFWWRGLQLLPLGDGESILFLSPMTTVIAARVFLKEKLPTTFIGTALISFAGLTFICQPSFIFSGSDYEQISWEGVLYLLGAVVCWSITCLLVRVVKNEAHWLQLEMAVTVQSIFVWCPLLIVITQFAPGASDIDRDPWSATWDMWVVITILGVFSFCALMCNVIGYQLGDATKVAWMEYLDLVFAFLYQWLYEKDIPDQWEIVGCMCLFSVCFINMGEEVYKYCRSKNAVETTDEKYMTDGLETDTRHSTPEQKVSGAEHEPLLKLVLPSTEVHYPGSNEYLSIQH